MDETMPMTQAHFHDLKDAGVLVTGGGVIATAPIGRRA